MNHNIKPFSLRPSLPDKRDYLYIPAAAPMRNVVDLREWASPVDSQSTLGSCSANAVVNAYELLTIKDYNAYYTELSRLFVYYNTRLIEETINTDSGAYISNAIKSVATYGVCSEELWSYDINKFTTQPTVESYSDAAKRKITNYRKLIDISNILDALNSNIPVVFGTTIHESFNNVSFDNPIVPIPTSNDPIIGGHAMCLVGYDYPKKLLLAKNSYGTTWGYEGYCWIPFEYAKTEFFDCWIFDIVLSFPPIAIITPNDISPTPAVIVPNNISNLVK